jgi:hypothetical protein
MPGRRSTGDGRGRPRLTCSRPAATVLVTLPAGAGADGADEPEPEAGGGAPPGAPGMNHLRPYRNGAWGPGVALAGVAGADAGDGPLIGPPLGLISLAGTRIPGRIMGFANGGVPSPPGPSGFMPPVDRSRLPSGYWGSAILCDRPFSRRREFLHAHIRFVLESPRATNLGRRLDPHRADLPAGTCGAARRRTATFRSGWHPNATHARRHDARRVRPILGKPGRIGRGNDGRGAHVRGPNRIATRGSI